MDRAQDLDRLLGVGHGRAEQRRLVRAVHALRATELLRRMDELRADGAGLGQVIRLEAPGE